MESMITMGGFTLPSKTIREMIVGSIDVIVQAARLRDGSRRITHITEVLGMEGDVIITQDLFVYDILGEDANGKHHRPASLDRHRPAALLGPRALLRREKSGLPPRSTPPKRRRSRQLRRASMTSSLLLQIAVVVLAAVSRRRRRLALLVNPRLSGERQSRQAARGDREAERRAASRAEAHGRRSRASAAARSRIR